MDSGMLGQCLGVFALSLYSFRFLHDIGLYRCILSWQFTIWSLHVAPVVSLRLLGVESLELLLVAWLGVSWAARGFHCCGFSLGMLALELAAFLGDLREWLEAFFALQLVIVSVFWLGMLVACCLDDFTFCPLDRHLHKGFRHFLHSAAAKRCFLHEFASHCVAQLLFADLLRRHLGYTPPLWPALLRALPLQAFYAAMVLFAAVVTPPHALPYSMGTVPKILQLPVPLPAWLRGDGARGSVDKDNFPWWAKMPQMEDLKRGKED
ncbi:unnamed protein product [Effrenium voratum]|uniref:Uncharacterized protein n=1 Tax=Effrenium voratum TaxID=2562239 RepID=A0AA36JDP2_9DINO|nr:unnamed protein product [Effrenium voratum]